MTEVSRTQPAEAHVRIMVGYASGITPFIQNIESIKFMERIFITRPLIKRSLFQKLFKQYPEENAIIEINNLLAQNAIKEVQTTQISQIEEKYSLSLYQKYHLNLQEFYAVYLHNCLIDKTLSEDEVHDLEHLKNLFSLTDVEVRWLNEAIGKSVYQQAMEEAISDGKLTVHEKTFLNQLKSSLLLSNELVNKITHETKNNFLQPHLDQYIDKGALSQEEEKDFISLARNIDVNIEKNSATHQILEQLKLYWSIENLELPFIDVDVPLHKGEKCFMHITGASWGELKYAYNAKSYLQNVSKSFFLGSKQYTPASYSGVHIKWIDNGDLYLTTKRILFIGKTKNSNVPFEKILSIAPFNKGVEIGKVTGKIPVISFTDRLDVFCITLEKILRKPSNTNNHIQ